MERGRGRGGGRRGGRGRGGDWTPVGHSRPSRTNNEEVVPGEGSGNRSGGEWNRDLAEEPRGPRRGNGGRGWSEAEAVEGIAAGVRSIRGLGRSGGGQRDQPVQQWRSNGGGGRGNGERRPAGESVAGEGSRRDSGDRDQSSVWMQRGSSDEGAQGRPVVNVPAGKVATGEGSGKYSPSQRRPSEAIKPDTHVSGMKVSKAVNQLAPVQRPDKCGTNAVRRVRLRVNHFLVRYNANTVIMHYDVDVKPEVPPKNGRAVRIPKPDLSMIRDKLFSDKPAEFPMSKTAYDGEKNIFSAERLPTGKFRVEISKGEDMRSRFYTVGISLVNELKLGKLSDYLSGCLTTMPSEILHGMNVVMNENPTREMISVGRSFYPKVPDPNDDLGYGIFAYKGFLHSLKLTSQGLSLCLDSSVLAFRKRMPVIEFLSEHIDGFNLKEFDRYRRDVEAALRGLKVYVNHRRTSQKFIVRGLTDKTARNSAFQMEDPDGKDPPKTVLLVDYFKEKYNRVIRHVDIPCLDLGKQNKRNDVPMEFCELVEGQRYNKELLDRNAAQTLKVLSLPQPRVRENTISNMVKSGVGPCGGGIARNFGIDVNMNMTAVEGRVIGPPELKLGGQNGKLITVTVDRDKCHWNLVGKSVVLGKPIDKWAVLDFRQNERGFNNFDLDPNAFIPKLIARCGKLGIRMTEPLFYERTSMRKFSSVETLHQLLEGISQRAYEICGDRLQLLVCSMNRRDPGYKYLKWICETKIGIVTQCCLSNLASKANDQYLANLALKINAKLGGSNVELTRQPVAALGSGHVMFVGADVNHPTGAWNPASPSIAAVVATVNWPASNRYAARVRAQHRRCETILNFGDMCLELVESYSRQNKVRPEKIIIFRDGVSEGQFEMVLNEELLDMRRAFAAVNYSPTITLVVAQKRHQTRLFPQSKDDGCSTGNVPPGTVVDTRVVHPFEFDFYLCSHYGSLGTSKPTHYHVLYDDHSFTSDQMQKLVYDMCFTMARCTKPVSLVPPVYYADLVAYRGRLYHEALTECHSGGSSSSSTQGSSSSLVALFDERFSKLHADLENEMFFV